MKKILVYQPIIAKYQIAFLHELFKITKNIQYHFRFSKTYMGESGLSRKYLEDLFGCGCLLLEKNKMKNSDL